MKVSSDYALKLNPNNTVHSRPIQTTALEEFSPKIREYNPPYYKPLSFWGSGFENYFPEDILGISEKEFDELIFKTIKNPSRRDELTEYITELTSQNRLTMNFINMWKKQIPSLVSQGIVSSVTGETSRVIQAAITNTSRNYTNSAFQKFLSSDHQQEIIKKDLKSAGAGLMSYKLFALASADPEPFSKIGLYVASLGVGVIGYAQRSKDAQKIQDMQYIEAVKEMLKIGVLDPYMLIQHIDKSRLNLNGDRLEKYEKWQENRSIELNYQKTGTTVDTHNDFDTPEALHALNMLTYTLRDMNMKDTDIADFLLFYGTIYASMKGTREAESLTRMALKAYEGLIDDEEVVKNYPGHRKGMRKKIWEIKENLAYLYETNQKYNEATELYDELRMIPEKPIALRALLNYLDISSKLNNKYYNLKVMYDEDAKISITAKRKKAYADFLNSDTYKYNSEKLHAMNQEDFNSIVYARLITKNLDYPTYKSLAMKLAQLPLESIDISPEEIYKKSIEYKYLTDKAFDGIEKSVVQKQIDNLTVLGKKLEEDVTNGELAAVSAHDKAMYLIGAGILNGNLRNIVTDILKKPDIKCNEIDAEILGICANNMISSMTDKEAMTEYFYENSNPLYINMYIKQLSIIKELYGYSSRKTYETFANIIKHDYSTQRIGMIHIPEMKTAPEDIKKDLLPELYAKYARAKELDILSMEGFFATEQLALDVIVPYVKYFETTKKIDETVLMSFLKCLDKIYKDNPAAQGEYDFDLRPRNILGMYYNDNTPMFDEINRYGNESEYEKYHKYLNWESVKDNIERWVQKSPGIYRANERKFLSMCRYHDIVFFANSHRKKMDAQITDIENKVNLPQII